MKNKLKKPIPYKYLFIIGAVLIVLSNMVPDEAIAGALDIAGLFFCLDALVVGLIRLVKLVSRKMSVTHN